jgi:hypothetical protein
MRRAARVDGNQADIVAALRKVGATVTLLHQLGGGVPDLLVSFRQRWYVMECKTENGSHTPAQKDWIAEQRAPVYTVTSAGQAVEFLTNVAPDWLLGIAAQASKRTHICEGPKPGSHEPMAEELEEEKVLLVDRVLEALRVAARQNVRLQSDEICDKLGASKTSKRVEKALRALCQQGLAHREGNNRRSVYWAELSQGST